MTALPDALSRFVAASQVPLTVAVPRDGSHPLLAVNGAFERLTGYSSTELVGRDCGLLQGRLTQPGARAAIRRGLRAGGEVHAVITNYKRDGEAFENFLFLVPLRDGDGRVQLVIGSQCALPGTDRPRALLEHGAFLTAGFGDLGASGLDGLAAETTRLAALGPRDLLTARLDGLGGAH